MPTLKTSSLEGPRICVAISAPSEDIMRQRLLECAPYADMAEIRLDALDDIAALDMRRLVEGSPLPIIFTNRPVWEGGGFRGGEEDRVSLLLKAAVSGAGFVDIELRTRRDLRTSVVEAARRGGCKVIVSFHDFSGAPDETGLSRFIVEEKEAGADIGKIVVTARNAGDVRRVLSLYSDPEVNGFPLIAFAMGPLGRLSRLACLALGSYLTFASHSMGAESAPGQIPVKDLRSMVDYFWGRTDYSPFGCA